MTDGAGRSTLSPLQASPSLAESAAELIRNEILAGRFRQGEHLVEALIAEQLNVSRGPVREAFKLLRAEELVQEEPRRGTFVVSIGATDVREIYGLRAAIEGRAARLLAAVPNQQVVRELRKLYAEMGEAAAQDNVAALYARDLAFHEGLTRLSGNGRLHGVFVRYVPTLRALLQVDGRFLESASDMAADHLPILEAIEAGNGALAAQLAEHHCDHAADMISGYLASLGSEVPAATEA
ncbi:MAG TPA: GntR family transcriptional regulator [Streptosporangiaceae bacterium]